MIKAAIIATAAMCLTLTAFAAVGVPSSVTVVSIAVVPNAPSNLTATAGSDTVVDLSWTDNSNNETGFSIERSTPSDTSFAVVGTTTANVTVYHDTGLIASTLYYYRIAAIGPGLSGNSPYSPEASTTTPLASLPPPTPSPAPPSGGGGGGGGYSPPPVFQTSAVFRGVAYPLSKVTLLQNAQVVAVTQAGPDAQFEVDLSGVAPGSYNFGVWAQDPSGSRSITQTFSISLTNGATTVISGLFFAPTIATDKIQVKKGEVVTIFGYAAPSSTVTIMVHSASTITQNVQTQASGSWFYKLNTDVLQLGDHTAQAHAATANDVTTDSATVTFTVGDTDIAAPSVGSCPQVGDLNGDCKVDLVDFSIMAYWYQRPGVPAAIDLNHDGKIDLVDFSILAYYWTG